MTTVVTRTFLSSIAAAALRADDWTGPTHVSQSAREFAGAAQKLPTAIQDVDEDSPRDAAVRIRSESAVPARDAVDTGVEYEVARTVCRKIERDQPHFDAGLKKA